MTVDLLWAVLTALRAAGRGGEAVVCIEGRSSLVFNVNDVVDPTAQDEDTLAIIGQLREIAVEPNEIYLMISEI